MPVPTSIEQLAIDWDPGVSVRHRVTDPETSVDAAKSVNLSRSRKRVLELFDEVKFGCDPYMYSALIRRGFQISPSGYRTRRSELVKLGLVRDSGRVLKLDTGRKAIIWERV